MRSGDCFIIVYSVTDRQSFQEAQSIYEFTKRIRDTDMPVVRFTFISSSYLYGMFSTSLSMISTFYCLYFTCAKR